jgi:hypothetical protein
VEAVNDPCGHNPSVCRAFAQRWLYAVQRNSCDDGCCETLAIYLDVMPAAVHAEAVNGFVAQVPAFAMPSEITRSEAWRRVYGHPAHVETA